MPAGSVGWLPSGLQTCRPRWDKPKWQNQGNCSQNKIKKHKFFVVFWKFFDKFPRLAMPEATETGCFRQMK